mmetsp:Transcript_9820/g.19926  ORF Transcript_9820/g.19926 Transcript_9820/m.19926 type:complete len:123 (+) Transcript_9820:195-563(+)
MPANLGKIAYSLAHSGWDGGCFFEEIFSGTEGLKNLLGDEGDVGSLIKVLWGAAILGKVKDNLGPVKVAWSRLRLICLLPETGARRIPWPLTWEDERLLRDFIRIMQYERLWGELGEVRSPV